MRYLFIAPHFGLRPDGSFEPGGLAKLGRCVARALASAPAVTRLDVWAQVDAPSAEPALERLLKDFAHPALQLQVRLFGGSRGRLAAALWRAIGRRAFDRVGYLLINQALLSHLPGHPPYDLWEIGVELFARQEWPRRRALDRAERLLSISRRTSAEAERHNPGLRPAQVVHPCLEPSAFDENADSFGAMDYRPAEREPAVLIVGNMWQAMPYKGHRQLIDAWPAVLAACPEAELWIVGSGDDVPELQARAQALSPEVARRIRFLGPLDEADLQDRYRRCRAFAMPSTGEGFGLVFLEAARHGVPCLGCREDAAAEIIVDGETGLLVDQAPAAIAAACLRLLTDEALAQRLGEGGWARLRDHFLFPHFRERLLDALNLTAEHAESAEI